MIANPASSFNFFISVSKSSVVAGYAHRHFYPLKIDSMAQLAEVMTHKVWSPCVWRDGLRLRENFLSASFIALDFDDGRLSLRDAKELALGTGLGFIIGTSKSHQKEKVTEKGVVQKACDRFRLVYRMSEETTLRDVYRYNMNELMDIYPCDPSCKDEARFFYGCTEITCAHEGEGQDWKPVPPQAEISEMKQRVHEKYKYYREAQLLPMWAESALLDGITPGGRHKTCYRLGATLIHLGYSEKDIVGLCLKGPLKDIGQIDIERAVANGAERSLREYDEFVREKNATESSGS